MLQVHQPHPQTRVEIPRMWCSQRQAGGQAVWTLGECGQHAVSGTQDRYGQAQARKAALAAPGHTADPQWHATRLSRAYDRVLAVREPNGPACHRSPRRPRCCIIPEPCVRSCVISSNPCVGVTMRALFHFRLALSVAHMATAELR